MTSDRKTRYYQGLSISPPSSPSPSVSQPTNTLSYGYDLFVATHSSADGTKAREAELQRYLDGHDAVAPGQTPLSWWKVSFRFCIIFTLLSRW
jgi:hypothetical protein